MGHKFRFIALLLVALTIVPLFAVPASAAYSYPMSLTIYYKDEAGNTLKSPYTGSFNAADHEGLKWYAPSISGYALKNDSDATITYEMLDKSFPASNYVRNGTATYTVVYVKTYTHLVYYLRGDSGAPIGSPSRKTAKPGTSYSFTSPSVTGMTPSKSTVSGTISSRDTSDTVYYYPITYTISYNANGGSGAPASQTKKYDVDINITTSQPTRTGYTFIGWSRSASSSTLAYSSGDRYTANASATLYAVWSAKKYTISYDANGGTGAPASQTKTYGLTMTLSSTNGKPEWTKARIQSILTNERYVGDMLLQKTFTENCISKKVRVNRGEMAKYLITNNHPAIVSRDVFQAVQSEMARRTSKHVRALVDCIKVNTDVTLTIVIKGGLSFTVEIPT